MTDSVDAEAIQIWKMKKLIKYLESARGNGTSMISLIVPPGGQISKEAKKLAEEYGTATNIKSRVNRQSVLTAIGKAQEQLKKFIRTPPNGLVVYCGTVILDDGKEKGVGISFEPHKPINTSLYLCDSRFHVEALQDLLHDDQKFGFIVMDGNGALFGTLSGNTRKIERKYTVDLPKKHGRGGQSALRFARLREEKRHNYVRRVAETAVEVFITNDKVNVTGIVLAGSADFKTDLNKSDVFDQRLQAKIISVVDISYGGETGFNQAIDLSAERLRDVKFIQEKKTIAGFFDEISKDSNKVCYGVDATLKALEAGAVERLVVWENLDYIRVAVTTPSGIEAPVYIPASKEKDLVNMKTSEGADMHTFERGSLLEWLTENFSKYGATLELVTDKSQEGAQFVNGFAGFGGFLRYQLPMDDLDGFDDDEDDDVYLSD